LIAAVESATPVGSAPSGGTADEIDVPAVTVGVLVAAGTG
jgi:hypothetical protein